MTSSSGDNNKVLEKKKYKKKCPRERERERARPSVESKSILTTHFPQTNQPNSPFPPWSVAAVLRHGDASA